MSEVTHESRSSAQIAQNSKGEPAISVKVYAESTEINSIEAAAQKALETYRNLVAAVGA